MATLMAIVITTLVAAVAGGALGVKLGGLTPEGRMISRTKLSQDLGGLIGLIGGACIGTACGGNVAACRSVSAQTV